MTQSLQPLRSKTSTIDIYIKLAQYPVLADRIRERMRLELFRRGIISEEAFEKEVHQLAIDSQKREGVYNPFEREPASVWQKRKSRLRDYHTDFYFGNNIPYPIFDELVQNALADQKIAPDQIELSFNPELAPLEMLFRQGALYESIPPGDRGNANHHLEEIKVVLIKAMISDHLSYVGVAKKMLTISDLRRIYDRRIGEGKIGGKAAGMVLAWKILQNIPHLKGKVSIPESYFVGSDVTYEFRAANDMNTTVTHKYRNLEEIRALYPEIVAQYLSAEFPYTVVEQLREVVTALSGRPIIVRSSSLLEDNFGFSFAGKYDSYFCPNQGTPEENLQVLFAAIKRIYASVLNPDVILYRRQHGLIDYDERMGILLQEVNGRSFGNYYFPTLAGVGFSQNAFRWHEKIRREDGFLRLVWGMGTRAVDRVSDDYPRLISLSHPHLRPETTAKAIRQYSQHNIDLIDLSQNRFVQLPVDEVLDKHYPFLRDIVSLDRGDFLQPILSKASIKPDDNYVLTFERITKDPNFGQLMRDALHALEEAYQRPVDIEFTIDILRKGLESDYHLNLLQCRPLSQRAEAAPVDIPEEIPSEDIIFESKGMVPDGQIKEIRYAILVDPQRYQSIPSLTDKLELGRVVSRLNAKLEGERFILLGPGRWGSSNIDLGVKVSYADIHNTRALIEIGISEGQHAPELSYGTHFFQDLVEAGIYSLPLHLREDGESRFNWGYFHNAPNQLAALLPQDAGLAHYLQVIDVPAVSNGRSLNIYMDGRSDRAVGFLEPA